MKLHKGILKLHRKILCLFDRHEWAMDELHFDGRNTRYRHKTFRCKHCGKLKILDNSNQIYM